MISFFRNIASLIAYSTMSTLKLAVSWTGSGPREVKVDIKGTFIRIILTILGWIYVV